MWVIVWRPCHQTTRAGGRTGRCSEGGHNGVGFLPHRRAGSRGRTRGRLVLPAARKDLNRQEGRVLSVRVSPRWPRSSGRATGEMIWSRRCVRLHSMRDSCQAQPGTRTTSSAEPPAICRNLRRRRPHRSARPRPRPPNTIAKPHPNIGQACQKYPCPLMAHTPTMPALAIAYDRQRRRCASVPASSRRTRSGACSSGKSRSRAARSCRTFAAYAFCTRSSSSLAVSRPC